MDAHKKALLLQTLDSLAENSVVCVKYDPAIDLAFTIKGQKAHLGGRSFVGEYQGHDSTHAYFGRDIFDTGLLGVNVPYPIDFSSIKSIELVRFDKVF